MTLPEPNVCPRCDGDGEVPVFGRWGLFLYLKRCPDCRCPDCGLSTAGGFCAECDDADWLDCELSYGRGQDR